MRGSKALTITRPGAQIRTVQVNRARSHVRGIEENVERDGRVYSLALEGGRSKGPSVCGHQRVAGRRRNISQCFEIFDVAGAIEADREHDEAGGDGVRIDEIAGVDGARQNEVY